VRRLRVEFGIELDEERLAEYKGELLDKGEVLYVEEKLLPGSDPVTIKHWPGEPEEWESIHDVVDLMQTPALAIVRAELIRVEDAPKPSVRLDGSRRRWWEVWKR
jgi:hypothetical protein